MSGNIEVLEKGMACLLEGLGVVETEQFISFILKEKFDYTKWQREKFDSMNAEEIDAAAAEYERKNPFVPARG